MTLALQIAAALVAAVPKILELIQTGRNPGAIRLNDILSTDALRTLEKAQREAQSYIEDG